jgi:hypothetical protein
MNNNILDKFNEIFKNIDVDLITNDESISNILKQNYIEENRCPENIEDNCNHITEPNHDHCKNKESNHITKLEQDHCMHKNESNHCKHITELEPDHCMHELIDVCSSDDEFLYISSDEESSDEDNCYQTKKSCNIPNKYTLYSCLSKKICKKSCDCYSKYKIKNYKDNRYKLNFSLKDVSIFDLL